ncbi:MAG: family 10 glycosylhydrolase [Planctomycetota bacterium]
MCYRAWSVVLCASCMLILCLSPSLAQERPFDYAAWVDHVDFYRQFDTEKTEGLAAILDHVQETGATTILWRNVAGSTMRYQTAVESGNHDSALDKRRVEDTRATLGWVRYGEAEPDIIRTVVKICKERSLRPGIHWPFEETHWRIFHIGRFNLEHPQYWCRTFDGRPWWGRVSIAYEPVIEHKLKLVDELFDRGIECLMIDFKRNGGWGAFVEYVPSVVESYRARYGEAPPIDAADIRWVRHVCGYVTGFLRRLRAHVKERNPNVQLIVAVPKVAPINEASMIEYAADWRTWVEEGLVDALMVHSVVWDAKDPLNSTRALYQEVLDFVNGRCKVYFPVNAYGHLKIEIPAYQKSLGKTQDEMARELAVMAWQAGADGIGMECVDFDNYREPTRKALKALHETKLRLAKRRAEE